MTDSMLECSIGVVATGDVGGCYANSGDKHTLPQFLDTGDSKRTELGSLGIGAGSYTLTDIEQFTWQLQALHGRSATDPN